MLALLTHVLSFQNGTTAGYQPNGVTASMCIDTEKSFFHENVFASFTGMPSLNFAQGKPAIIAGKVVKK
jgi:hypothetical protein